MMSIEVVNLVLLDRTLEAGLNTGQVAGNLKRTVRDTLQ